MKYTLLIILIFIFSFSPCCPINDKDKDSICDEFDNCPTIYNPEQNDKDLDKIGDVCDNCPEDKDNDLDNDKICADVDNCPEVSNNDQRDCDNDNIGDVCDPENSGPDCIVSQISSIYWNGLGGDIWNSNSSPFEVNPTNPFGILWASYSKDGQYHRPSGIILADVGDNKTPYLFGSTGWGENRPYRVNRNDGTHTSWTAKNGANDSGTGFRIAISPDAKRIYHIDCENYIRAYDTENNPSGNPIWEVKGVSGNRGIANLIKVGPDGRIYGHFNGTTALDPNDGSIVWESEGNPEDAFMPGAFFDKGTYLQYIVSGRTNIISAYNISSLNKTPIWTYTDSEPGFSGPTVDPVSGNIYIFRSTRVIKLTSSGNFVWASEKVSKGEEGKSLGALSRDGQTFYYQTGTFNNKGKLYAFNTKDGSIKWKVSTNAYANEWFGGPVVSKNGLIFLSNGARTPGDNKLFCIKDGGENNPIIIDTFDMEDEADSGAPFISIGPDGVVFVDGWAIPNNPLLYAFKTRPIYNGVSNVTATPFYSTVKIKWDKIDEKDVAGYLIYRRKASESYSLKPTKYIGPRTQFTDYNLEPFQTYYYKIASYNVAGTPNSLFTEISVTLSDSEDKFAKHANLELLMAVYTEGWTPTELEQYINGLKNALKFYWRNSKGQLNLDVTWFFIDSKLPSNDGAYVEDDLKARGIRDHQYDLLYIVGKDFCCCWGGFLTFGSTATAEGIVCGVPYPGKDLDVNYTISWTFTHEIHHAIDLLASLAGAEDMLFNHFPWNYPSPLDGTLHVDWGTHYDGIAKIMRTYNDYFNFSSPYDGYIESIDYDNDFMPDNDERVPLDEFRFGTNPNKYDTDEDGLSDLDEFTRYNFTGTDPNRKDTDEDGIIDGVDSEPIYRISPVIKYIETPPLIDGIIEKSWNLLTDRYYFTQNISDFYFKVFANYDSNNLYFAIESSKKLRFMISIDGSGYDGRFESDVRHPDGTQDTLNEATKSQQYGDSWGDGNHLYTYYGANSVEVFGVGNIANSKSASTFDGNLYRTEIKIPKKLPHGCAYTWYLPTAPVVEGLRLNEGQVIGLNMTFSNFEGSSGNEFSGIWTSLFETHSYVDFTLSR